MPSEFEETLMQNYKLALQQKYNAVCLDIDGTLTKLGSKEIDVSIVPILADLLIHRVPIVFITGRGETGTKQYFSSFIEELKREYQLDHEQLSKVFALTNDGARLMFTDEKSNHFLDQSIFVSDIAELDKLENVKVKLEQLFETELKDKMKITYSIESNSNRLMNIRAVLETRDPQTIMDGYTTLERVLRSEHSDQLNITKGYWNGNTVFQIGTTTKDIAIRKTEELIGIPQNSMLRIGDCGGVDGNDYSMLQCPQGFSVDETSGSVDACFPVMDEMGNRLVGPEGTKYLLTHANLLVTICLEKAEEKNYRKNYAFAERKINIGRVEHLKKYNALISDALPSSLDINGIYNVYDQHTGSVFFPMFDWELIDSDNPLKQFWDQEKNGMRIYSLNSDECVLLRGSSTYYSFFTNRYYDSSNKKVLSHAAVSEWLHHYYSFFKEGMTAIQKTKNWNFVDNKKMILGVLDNVRNVSLVLMNNRLNQLYEEENVLLNFEQLDRETHLYQFYQVLCLNDDYMSQISFDKNTNLYNLDIINLLRKTNECLYRQMRDFSPSIIKYDYSDDYRTYREIDNFAENFITVDLAKDKMEDPLEMGQFGVCGLCYGGLELPVISKVINSKISDVSIMKFRKSVSDYRKKHSVEIRNFSIKDYGDIKLYGINPKKKYILADDNLLTAKTMQLAINTMYDKNIEVDSLMIVRYPSMNRVSQMFMEKHGAVDYHQFFGFIKGLCFPSPYTWRDENQWDEYQDSLGVFDRNRKKILEYLYKNHDYRPNTEVARIKEKQYEKIYKGSKLGTKEGI